MRVLILIILVTGLIMGCAEKDPETALGKIDPVYKLTAGVEHRYSIVVNQVALVSLGHKPKAAERTYNGTYKLTGMGADGDNRSGKFAIDDLAVALKTAEATHDFKTAHLDDKNVGITLSPRRVPVYTDPDGMPEIDLRAVTGGFQPVSFLFDYAFPRLPDGPAAIGDTWVETAKRTGIEASIPVTSEVTTTHRLAGFELFGGFPCLKVESTSEATVSTTMEQAGKTWTYTSTLAGTGTWYFAPESGVLVGLTALERSEGEMSSDGITAGVKQQSSIELHLQQ